MESISAIIFGLILMLPLLIQLQTLAIRSPWKLLATLRECYLTEESERDGARCSRRKLVQHYPKLPELLNPDSESRMIVCAPRNVYSSPAVASADVGAVSSERSPAGKMTTTTTTTKTIPLAQHSSSFIATQIELPVVDITCNYNACRYKSFETCLRQLYGANYPPGEVVLNYIQLNTSDSRIGIRRENDGRHLGSDDHDLLLDQFDNGGASSYAPSVSTRLESEYLNLLDHFVSRQRGRVPTAGKFTEMLSSDDRCHETSSHAGTWSQSTLRDSVFTREKESRSRGRDAHSPTSKGIEYGQGNGGGGGGANRRPDGSQRVLRRR